jgi:hypothetical protein
MQTQTWLVDYKKLKLLQQAGGGVVVSFVT